LIPEIAIERFEIFANCPDHPECLGFDRDGMLWARGEAGQIYRIDPAGRLNRWLSSASFGADWRGRPTRANCLSAILHGVVRVGRSGFESRGNYYVTDSGGWKQRDGRLPRLRVDGTSEEIGRECGYGNGLALSADERYLFLVEIGTGWIYRIALASGDAEVYAEEVGGWRTGSRRTGTSTYTRAG
jgi:gluconolactonase